MAIEFYCIHASSIQSSLTPPDGQQREVLAQETGCKQGTTLRDVGIILRLHCHLVNLLKFPDAFIVQVHLLEGHTHVVISFAVLSGDGRFFHITFELAKDVV
jgi:hypothetical protein